MAQMNNYLNNNIVLINMYENLYANGIRIDEIIQMFKKGEFAQYSGFDFGRFRVFVDGCLLLLNKEKLNRYYKDEWKSSEGHRQRLSRRRRNRCHRKC